MPILAVKSLDYQVKTAIRSKNAKKTDKFVKKTCIFLCF